MVRWMTIEDLPIAIAMGEAMHKESYYKHFDYDPMKLQKLWELSEAHQGFYGKFVAENSDGKIVGMFVGMCAEHYFGHDKIATDLLLYVTPEARGGSAAPRLVKAYEKWARESGAKEIHVGVSTGVNEDRTARLYEKLGFHDKAILLRKRI
jgi:GNAT superfamily N-acetyltransferase